MKTWTMAVHQHPDGRYTLSLNYWETGDVVRSVLNEESHPMPHVAFSDAFSVAAQMAVDAISATEPSPGLWEAVGGFHSGS